MQIKTGTASVTNGSNRVIFATADLSAITLQAIFSLDGVRGAPLYPIIDIQKPVAATGTSAWANSASGLWEIFLSVPYAQITNAAAAFLIQKDFLTITVGGQSFYKAIFEVGDTQTLPLINLNTIVQANIDAAFNVRPFAGIQFNSYAMLEAFDVGHLAIGDLVFVTIDDSTQFRQLQAGTPEGSDRPVLGTGSMRWRQTGGT